MSNLSIAARKSSFPIKLIKTLLKYCEDNFSKWLLTVAMLLGVFAFTGYNNKRTLFNNVKAQTELVCAVKTSNKIFTVAFKKVIATSNRHHFSDFVGNHSTTLLLTYSKLIKVKFDSISKLYQSIDQAHKFVQVKNIPSHSGKDVFIAVG